MQKGGYTNKSVMKILTTVLIFISFNLNANEEKLREWAYINTIDDMLGCSAYYFISAIGLQRANNSEHEQVMNHSDKLAFMAAFLAENIDIKKETLDSKLKLHINNQLKIIDNNYNNLSLLTIEYLEPCVDWFNDNFKSRILYWVQKYPN